MVTGLKTETLIAAAHCGHPSATTAWLHCRLRRAPCQGPLRMQICRSTHPCRPIMPSSYLDGTSQYIYGLCLSQTWWVGAQPPVSTVLTDGRHAEKETSKDEKQFPSNPSLEEATWWCGESRLKCHASETTRGSRPTINDQRHMCALRARRRTTEQPPSTTDLALPLAPVDSYSPRPIHRSDPKMLQSLLSAKTGFGITTAWRAHIVRPI